MKHLKQFENYKGLKVGDIVEVTDTIDYCIGEIIKINGDKAYIDTINGDDDMFCFIDYIKLANAPNAKKFRIDREAKKFNL